MAFKKNISLALNHALEAAFGLLHWQQGELNIPLILAYRLMLKNKIRILGVPNSGKSHIARIVNLLPNYTVTEVQIEAGGNYLKLDGDGYDTEIYEYKLIKSVSSKDMEVFGRCISAVRALLNAQEHYEALNQ